MVDSCVARDCQPAKDFGVELRHLTWEGFFDVRISAASTAFYLSRRLLVPGVLLLSLANAQAAILNAVYHSAADVPVTTAGDFTASGITVNFDLNFAPPVGTNLTVVRLTGLGTINGVLTNLAQGQAVTLGYGGQVYNFVANYYGGTGNDLVLQWANTRAMAWGNNGDGQLGNSSTMTSNLPVAVSTLGALSGKTIIALSAGRNHSLALCSDGTVAAWGLNSLGQIGSNGGSQSTVPVIVSTLGVLAAKRVIAVAAGEAHNLALCSDGTVAAWGYNANGQLGSGGISTTATPSAVNTSGVLSGKRVVAIAAGQNHSVALLSDGTVAAWGYNFYGQLGDSGNATSTVPVLVNRDPGVLLGRTVTAIAAGQVHCLALCSDGTLASWGANSDGQLGDGGTTASNVPVLVTTAGTFLATRTVTSIAAGAFHSLALCSDGTVASWGLNTYGQLGRISGSSLVPGGVNTSGALLGKAVTAVTGGNSHSLAQCSDGTLTSWGRNSFGELGTGSYSQSAVPQNVSTAPLSIDQRFATVFSGPNAFHSLTVAASPPQPGQLTTGTLISNGSFESGFSNWSVSDLNGPFVPLQVRSNGFNPGFGLFASAATDGNFSACSGFDGYGPGIVRLAHDVTVTTSEPFLRFDYRAGWDMLTYGGSTKARTFAVTIEPDGGGPDLQNTTILTADADTKNLDTGVQNGFVDLSAYIGTTVRVCFDLMIPEPSTGPAFFQLDNVRTAALLPASTNPITRAPTDVTIGGATMNATVNANGLVTTVQFEFGLTTSYGNTVTAVQSPVTGNTDIEASKTVSGLNPNTTYHYRVKTTNSGGVKVGADSTLTTLPHAPLVGEFGTSAVSSSSVLSYAMIYPDSATTVVTFEYGPTTAYGSTTPAWESPITENAIVKGQISGLTGGMTCHYRVKAQNAGGTTYSEDATFTPDPAPPGSPTVNTQPPTLVDRSHGTLNGTVNANGSNVTVDFESGNTTNYDHVVSASPSAVSGGTATAFSGTWGQLSPGTTYHYRARASGPNGFVYGPDVMFTTPAIGYPAASTAAATDITQTTAILNGYASGNNGPQTTVSFEYGPDTNYGSVVTVPGYAQANSFSLRQAQIPVSGESVTYHYRIKAKNNIGTTYGQDTTFTTPNPHEAKLYGLTFSSGTLSPVFDRDVTTYTMNLPFETATLWLTPTASTGIESVTVNGIPVTSGGTTSAPFALNFGGSVFTIVVTALDGMTQQTYTVTVTRAGPVPGNLDLAVNGTGHFITDISASYDYAKSVAIQSDGQIVVAGYSFTGSIYAFAVARYNSDGTPDTAFNGTGMVTTDIGGIGSEAHAIALQSDGKIVVAGNASNGSNNDFAVVRYNPNGSLDTSFNGTGKVITPVGSSYDSGTSVVVQSDGKIIVAGSAFNDNLTDYDFALVRYHGNISTGSPGALDTSFNGTGKVVTPLGAGDDHITSMALDGNGKIVVAGYSGNGADFDGALARFETNGMLDTDFNGTGHVTTSLSTGDDRFNAIAVQVDGSIVAAGYASDGGNADFALVRYTSTGGLDTTFSGTGKVVTPIGTGNDTISGIALQSDGKIVVAGVSDPGGEWICTAARYEANGSLDTTFRGTGKTTIDLGYGYDQVGGVALQGDGKIVVAGWADEFDFEVVRLLGDGPAIAVQYGAGTAVFDNLSSVDFGGVLPGTATSIAFTIRNTGTADLTGLDITLDTADSVGFRITSDPVAPVPPAGVTTFTVRFLPTALGPGSSTLHIASNATGNSHSFDFNLTGAGLTVAENWRQQFFSSTGNTGDAHDLADPNGNGINNLLEYALGGDPAGNSTGTSVLPEVSNGSEDCLQLTFSRLLDRSDIILTVQANDTLTGTWTDLAQSVNGAAFAVLATGATVHEAGSGDTRLVTIGDLYPIADPAHPRRFMRLQVTRP